MKHYLPKPFFAILLLLGLEAAKPAPQPLTPEEISYAKTLLSQTRDALETKVKTLSETQFAWKAAPEKWSVLECLEHLVNAEAGVAQMELKQLPASPVLDATKQAALTARDKAIVAGTENRATHVKTVEQLEPKGIFKSGKNALAAFNQGRNATIHFLETTHNDLRAHSAMHPALGELDAYQWLLMLAAHTDRHTQQIAEVMGDVGFPKQ